MVSKNKPKKSGSNEPRVRTGIECFQGEHRDEDREVMKSQIIKGL